MPHPLASLITAAAAGRYPAPDGGWTRVSPWRTDLEAVLAFTGHAVLAVAADVPDETLRRVDGWGAAHHPLVALELAGPTGWIDVLDALLVLPPGPRSPELVDRPDLGDHDRVRFARSVRDEVRVLGEPDRDDAVATLSRGIAGLPELSVELAPGSRRRGAGTAFVRSAAQSAPPDLPLVAAVAPGNAASLRAFLGAGFQPVGSVQLIRPRRY